jgi:hypothetical protein
MNGSSHENLQRPSDLKPGSNRNFGLVMAAFFLMLAAYKLWSGRLVWAAFWGALAAGFAGSALVAPALLAPLNLLWFRFGLLLHRIVSPIVMGLLFFAVMTPIGLVMRLFGQRPLALGFDREAASYWIPRANGTPAPGSMRKQY